MKFEDGNFNLSGEPHPERPPRWNVKELEWLREIYPTLGSQCLPEQLHWSHTATENSLNTLRCKYSVLFPHKLTKFQLQK